MPSPKGRGGRSSFSSRGAAAHCFTPGTTWEKRAVTGIGAEVRSLTFSYKWCISVMCSQCTAGEEHWWYSRITQESPQGCEGGTRQFHALCWASLPSAAVGSSLRAPALALALWFHSDAVLHQCSPVHSCQLCGASCSCWGVALLPAALLGMPSEKAVLLLLLGSLTVGLPNAVSPNRNSPSAWVEMGWCSYRVGLSCRKMTFILQGNPFCSFFFFSFKGVKRKELVL